MSINKNTKMRSRLVFDEKSKNKPCVLRTVRRSVVGVMLSGMLTALGCSGPVVPTEDVPLDRGNEVSSDNGVQDTIQDIVQDNVQDTAMFDSDIIPTDVEMDSSDVTDATDELVVTDVVDVVDVPVVRPTLTLTPRNTTVVVDGSDSFIVNVSNSTNEDVELTVTEAGGGRISPLGLYEAPSVEGTYHVVATLIADRTVQATSTVTVRPLRHQLVVGPRVVTLGPQGTVAFNAVSLDRSGALSWSVEESGGGTVNQFGQYVAPATTGTYHVRVSSVADGTLTDVATVRVVSALAATISTGGRTPAVVITPPGMEQWLYFLETMETAAYRTQRWITDEPSAAIVHNYSDVTGIYPHDIAAVSLRSASLESVSEITGNDVAEPRMTISIPVVTQNDNPLRVAAPRAGIRRGSTITALPDGRVVIAGGRQAPVGTFMDVVLSSIEVFDPLHGRVTRAASFLEARYNHAATLLADGTILFTGGRSSRVDPFPIATAEIFDPATNTVTRVGDLNAPREWHVAQRLPSGDVLIVYGLTTSGTMLNFAEVYEPSRHAFRVLLNPPTVNRAMGARAVLVEGRVYTFGGRLSGGYLSDRAVPEVYDPTMETFTSLPVAPLTRQTFPVGEVAIAPLSAGRVLVTGIAQGVQNFSDFPQSVIYDTRTNAVTVLPANGFVARSEAHAIVGRGGRVFVIGGTYWTHAGSYSARDIEVFDEARLQLVPFARMMSPISRNTASDQTDFAVGLPDGRIVIADGLRNDPGWPWWGRTITDQDVVLFNQ